LDSLHIHERCLAYHGEKLLCCGDKVKQKVEDLPVSNYSLHSRVSSTGLTFFKKTVGEAGLKRKLGPSSRKPRFMNDFLNTHDLR
jgi:hypothetical protein